MSGLKLKVTGKSKPQHFGQGARTARVLRELEAEDIEGLGDVREEESPIKPHALKRLSERHHRLARALAAGQTNEQAGFACGYVASRVSVLRADPSFSRLVEHYKRGVEEQFFDAAGRLADVTEMALGTLADRLEDSPDEFTNGELMGVAKLGADRIGHGPSSKTEMNVTVGLADRLSAARARMAGKLGLKTEEAVTIDPDTGEILDG